ncbi:MAG: hypothetical protein ABJG78_06845 [Cyclobacteriaceae bacterium]
MRELLNLSTQELNRFYPKVFWDRSKEDMDQESFESLMKSKMDEGRITPPQRVWTGISSSLSDEAIVSLQSTHNRYKWVAVAAVFIAVFSFALNVDISNQQNVSATPTSFNALLPTDKDHFRFEANSNPTQLVEDYRSGSNILFVRENKDDLASALPIVEMEDQAELVTYELAQVEKILPPVSHAEVSDGYVSPYYVAQVRSGTQKRGKQEKTFWAGLEAGAGSFNPSFSGTDAISTDVDFGTLASNLGQKEFVNPTSTAAQNGMNEGVATSLGIDFGVKVGKRWSVESGIQYTSIQNQANASVNIIDTYSVLTSEVGGGEGEGDVSPVRTKQVEENFDQTLNLDNSLSFTSIPIKAGYSIIDSKLSLRLNAGLSANYFLTSRLTDPSGQIQTSDQSDAYNVWSFDGLTGFEFGYSISNNFNLTLEPNYRQSITPLSESLSTRSGFMIQTGLRYTIK